MLKPNYTPFPPRLKIPPPLPIGERTLLEIDSLPVRGYPYKPKQARSPQSVGRKWSRLHAQDEEDKELEAAELDDLPKFDRSQDAMQDIFCRRKPPESATSLLSQAYRMVDPPSPDEEPPTSIHFDTFARKVDELVSKGLIS